MPDFKLTTPVAFIIFNRPDTTEQVFAEIAKAKPTKLLVIADGARANKAGEAAKVVATRAIIERVDWDCEVLTNYSEINLGCKRRVSSGIDWVFEQVEEAIILEDDCLPDSSFFRFCQEMLERYRADQRIAIISGTNLSNELDSTDSYYFSRYPHIWGWASWRRVWEKYDVGMESLSSLIESKSFQSSFEKKAEWKHWVEAFTAVREGKVDTWDAQVMFLAFTNSMLSIFPTKNMISNLGFRPDATHTTAQSSSLSKLSTSELLFPLKHPQFVIRNFKAEYDRNRIELVGQGLIARIFGRIKNKIRGL